MGAKGGGSGIVVVEVVDLGVLHRLEVLHRLQLRPRRLPVQPGIECEELASENYLDCLPLLKLP